VLSLRSLVRAYTIPILESLASENLNKEKSKVLFVGGYFLQKTLNF
jgi:hypothetical protein